MVCVYCGAPTQVTNSRHQNRNNHIWRRRKCLTCSALFTTDEQPELASALVVRRDTRQLEPFNRDRLFIAIYESCKHRPTAIADAAYLTQVIMSQLLKLQRDGAVSRGDVIAATARALERFDQVAGVVYAAYYRL